VSDKKRQKERERKKAQAEAIRAAAPMAADIAVRIVQRRREAIAARRGIQAAQMIL